MVHRTRPEQSADQFLASGLSKRKLDVLDLLEKRLTNKEIAQRLFVSPETVKMHVSRIHSKLDVHSRRQAVATASRLNLLPERRCR